MKFRFSFNSIYVQFILFLVFTASVFFVWYAPKFEDIHNPAELREQFFTEYGNFYEAFRIMQERNFLVADLNKSHAYVKKFAGHFQLESICDDYFDECLWNNLTYKTLDGEIIPAYFGTPNVGQFRTSSGALYMIYSYGNEMWVFVDINGIKKKPNRFGLDTFAFYIDEDGTSLRLMGAAGTPFQTMNLYCNPYQSNKYNGLSCPLKATLDKDYFNDTLKVLY